MRIFWWGLHFFNNRSLKRKTKMYHWKFPFQIMSAMKFFSSEKWAFEKKEKALAPALLDLDILVKYNFYAYNNLILGLSIISIQIGHVGIRSCNWIQSGTQATMNSTFSTVLYLSTYSLLVKKKLQFEDVWRVFLLHLFRGGE